MINMLMNGSSSSPLAIDNLLSAPSNAALSAPTFFITDRRMLQHKCEWDSDHIEKPERLKTVLEVFEKENVLDQCQLLESAECSHADLTLVHSPEYIESIYKSCASGNIDQMEDYCKKCEDIYLNKHSWECALLAVGCAMKAMEAVLLNAKSRNDSLAPNAFAAIRPPGHHASRDAACGFCLFNNISICAKKARLMGVKRVLILDWDIHAGQGTQYCINDDPGIVLISAHRYEHGHYWPLLQCSDVLHEYPNTINVPLNELGCGDAEYAAFMHFLVLPFIQHWEPELILVSCGFDAALGDPQGEMEITPAGFGYMTGLIAQLGIPTCLLLEGGYFLESVGQGALFCMRALLQRSPPIRNFCQRIPSPSFLRTLCTSLMTRTKDVLLFDAFIEKLNTLRQWIIQPGSTTERRIPRTYSEIKFPEGKTYFGERNLIELAMKHHLYPTRGQYPPREPAVECLFMLRLEQLIEQYSKGLIERAAVDFDLTENGDLLLVPLTNKTIRLCVKNGNGGNFKTLFTIRTQYQFLIFYYYFLLPMSFTFFDVHISNMQLPLNAQQLNSLLQLITAKFDREEYWDEEQADDGITQELDLKKCLKIFPQMKPFYLF